ncbi:MAG: biotin/lipoyl-binding protein [Clostridia bacterium]|nr:biotin/lipoyl-binding protein [Clostridia bacterium]
MLEEPAGVQLNAVRAYIGELSEISVFEGSVIAYAEEFYFEQEGVVEEMHVVIGQQVSAGDPLITLNTEAEEKRLQSLEKEIERLLQNGEYEDRLAQLDMAMLELELQELMSRTPRDENAEMLKKLDMEELQLKTALNKTLRQMTLSELESERERLLEEISRNVLYAPFDGRVMYMTSQLQRGSYVSAYTPLLYLADDTRLLVECEYITNAMLDSAHELYALVGAGQYAITPVEVDPQEYLSKVLAGEELRLQFTFDQLDETLAPGQYAAVCVTNNYVADALLIPTNALYAAEGSLYVYVMEDGVRVRRDVKRGATTDWLTQIVEGLEEGELVYVKE